MATSLGHGIWNRYVHPGVVQRSAVPIGGYRRLSLTNPDFASAIYNRQGSTNDSVSHEALPVVSLRPISDESASSDPIGRVSEITPLSAVQRVPDTNALVLPSPIEAEKSVSDNTPAVKADTVPERLIVRPNALQRASDTTMLTPTLVMRQNEAEENSSAIEASVIPPERLVVQAEAVQRAQDMTPLALPLSPVEREGQAVSSVSTVDATAILPENPVVRPNAIQRTPEMTSLTLPSAPVVREEQVVENNPAVEATSVPPELPVVRPVNIIQRASDQLPIPRAAGNENSQKSENIVVQAQPAHENTSTPVSPASAGISQTALAPLVFRSAVSRSPETNIVVQASPVSEAAPPRFENAHANPINNTAPSLSAGPIIQRAEGDSSSAEQSNSDELIDRMMQKFMRRLAVENERRGRW